MFFSALIEVSAHIPDIVCIVQATPIMKPDEASGVVVIDKSDYVRLLRESSINNETKFRPVCAERPKMRQRPPMHFHPLLQKEKELTASVERILPKAVAGTARKFLVIQFPHDRLT